VEKNNGFKNKKMCFFVFVFVFMVFMVFMVFSF